MNSIILISIIVIFVVLRVWYSSPKNIGIGLNDDFTLSVTATTDHNLTISVDGAMVCELTIAEDLQGRIGFLQTGNCSTKITACNANFTQYERPENPNISENFETEIFNDNWFTMNFISSVRYPAYVAVEELDGNLNVPEEKELLHQAQSDYMSYTGESGIVFNLFRQGSKMAASYYVTNNLNNCLVRVNDSLDQLNDSIEQNVKQEQEQLQKQIDYVNKQKNICEAVILIGLITGAFSAMGIFVGNVFGSRYKSRAELAGGIILIAMGLKILLEHTILS